jgi:hypothetical protein
MEENKQIKKKPEGKLIACHQDLIKILDDIEAPVKDFTWGVVKLGYFEKTNILAQKIKAKKI